MLPRTAEYDSYGLDRGWMVERDFDWHAREQCEREMIEREKRMYEELQRSERSEAAAKAQKQRKQPQVQIDKIDEKPCSSTDAERTVDKKNVSKKSEEINMANKNEEKSVFNSIVDTVTATTKEDAVDASWRTAAAEATEIAKPVAKQILKEVGGTFAKPLIAGIDTPIGTGAVSWVTGWAIMGYGPLRGKELGPKTMRLSKELRIAGIQPLTNALAKRFIAPMRKRLTALLEDLPSLVGES